MELFIVVAVTANVLLTAVCAYCLSLAVYSSSNDAQNDFLGRVTKYTRRLVIVGGSLFIAFIVWSLVILTGSAWQ